jgi:hypothetical protein
MRADQEQATVEPRAGFSDTDFDMLGAGGAPQVDPGNKDGKGIVNRFKQWRCGNANDTSTSRYDIFTDSAINTRAGIQLLRGQPGKGTLKYLKALDKPFLTAADQSQPWFQTDFSDLFCGDYISQYRNPRTNAADYAGVCIRDNTEGYRWKSIVQTDKDARDAWIRFGNLNGNPNVPLEAKFAGYQKADGNLRPDLNMSNWNYQWGSGGRGDLPANWCSKYMKEFLCHIAFPQYAGPKPPTEALQKEWKSGNTPRVATETNVDLLLVRPVCKEFCSSIMDNCNRHEGEYSEGAKAPKSINWAFIQRNWTSTGILSGRTYQNLTRPLDIDDTNGDDREISESNTGWCNFWNRGFGLAQSGTGVGKGDDADVEGLDGTKRFCVTWDAGSSAMPTLALTVMAFIAVVAGGF